MNLFSLEHAILQELHAPLFDTKNVKVYVKRDDLIDKEVSGNKWRKLKYSMELAMFQKKEGILSFGGAFSNHLLAVASACNKAGLKSIGIVRGEELNASSNSNLLRCSELGMELQFISRTAYSECNEKWSQELWKEQYPTFLVVPEGGANFHGMVGCQEILTEIPFHIDHVFVAQGTAATSCGILTALPDTSQLHVVPVLKGFDIPATMKQLLMTFYLDEEVVQERMKQVVIHDQFHFGGYGKMPDNLLAFARKSQLDFQFPLDGVYTAKVFFALIEMLQSTNQLDHSTIVFVHTGGVFNAPIN
jgi:1-aminocyclopropane-1-carboxylate deaminase